MLHTHESMYRYFDELLRGREGFVKTLVISQWYYLLTECQSRKEVLEKIKNFCLDTVHETDADIVEEIYYLCIDKAIELYGEKFVNGCPALCNEYI
jgi:hypothetical protein